MMRSILKALLAATALMPVAAMAQDNRPDRGDRGGFRQQRGGGGDRPQRADRAPQPQARQQQAQPQARQQQARPQPQQARQFQRAGRPDAAGQRAPNRQFQQQRRGPDQVQADRFQSNRFQGRQPLGVERRNDRGQVPIGQLTGSQSRADRRNDGQRVDRTRARQQFRQQDGRRGYGNDRYRDQNRLGDRSAQHGRWNRGWRSDNRYDYNRYRSINRNIFRLPRYYAPYGWDSGYRRFSIGFSLSSVLFGENYWIDDPGYYRLPPADWPYRWVRYYNDALLVDTETGEVVDTVYDIFW